MDAHRGQSTSTGWRNDMIRRGCSLSGIVWILSTGGCERPDERPSESRPSRLNSAMGPVLTPEAAPAVMNSVRVTLRGRCARSGHLRLVKSSHSKRSCSLSCRTLSIVSPPEVNNRCAPVTSTVSTSVSCIRMAGALFTSMASIATLLSSTPASRFRVWRSTRSTGALRPSRHVTAARCSSGLNSTPSAAGSAG